MAFCASAPPASARRSTKSEIFETGIKVIDVLVPLERGGKAQRAAYRAVAGDLKLAYSQFEELETFARFGTRLAEDTRKTIAHGRRIRACLKQPELSSVSVPAQIAVLRALSAGLFDAVPMDRMTAPEHSVHEAASKISSAVSTRLDTADKLSREDRKMLKQPGKRSKNSRPNRIPKRNRNGRPENSPHRSGYTQA